MNVQYELTAEAMDDLNSIWLFIASDNPKAADRVENAILEACQLLSGFPMSGKTRKNITDAQVRFKTVSKFRN